MLVTCYTLRFQRNNQNH